MFDDIINIVAMSDHKIAIQYLDLNKGNPHATPMQLTNNKHANKCIIRV